MTGKKKPKAQARRKLKELGKVEPLKQKDLEEAQGGGANTTSKGENENAIVQGNRGPQAGN
ncbi:MAG: hypothetical protein KC777_15635 [Cyanobacteria bacterium HKST-UBA02]|nr:hypothetical protein [Cyanobacteria bacterium HKST-UBA02]